MEPELTTEEKDIADQLGISHEAIKAQKAKDQQKEFDARRMQDALWHGGPFAEHAALAKSFGCSSIAEYQAKHGEPVDDSVFDDPAKFRAHLAEMELKAAAEWRATEAEIKRRSREEFYAKHGLT